MPASTACASSPPCSPAPSRRRRCGTLELRRRRSPPCPGRRRPSGHVLARAQGALGEHTSCPGVTVTSRSAASASSREAATSQPSSAAALAARARVDVPERDGAASGEERPRRGRPLTPAPITAAVWHPRGRASRRRAPQRHPCERRDRRPRRALRAGGRRTRPRASTTPVTVGSPCAGLPGNDVIHLSSAWPPPSAGIARKSPAG